MQVKTDESVASCVSNHNLLKAARRGVALKNRDSPAPGAMLYHTAVLRSYLTFLGGFDSIR